MNSPFEQVIASYHRARQSGPLFDSFYRIFLAKSPEIPAMFARTDFSRQKLMLRESVLEMLVYFQTNSGLEEIARLAEKHRLLHVQPKHFALWLDALCESLAEHDPQFTPELEQLWRAAMQPGLAAMVVPCGT